MRYRALHVGPNRKARRHSNAITRRDPSPENIEANNEMLKAPKNKPYRKPKEAA